MADDAAVLAEIARLTNPAAAAEAATAPATTSNTRTTTPAPPPAGGYRNQTLVLDKPACASTAPSRSGSLSAPPSAAPSRRTSPAPDAAPARTPAPAPQREVVIDGVVFVADQRGNKLVRKPDADRASATIAAAGPPSPSLSTPKRASHLGTTYIRTKAGNLVSLAFARRRKELADAKREEMSAKGERLDRLVGVVKGVQAARSARGRGMGRGRGGFTATRPVKPKSDKLCRFFQRTGQCSRAHTCPYVHDSSKIAICPLFLRASCPRPASTCPLSHAPNAHRAPHCVHFPSCTRGAACPYAHVRVSADAAPCREFVELGWCERGEECGKRHVRECWRFAETGKCEVKGCREPHVLRRVHSAEEEDGEEGEEEGEEVAIEWEEGAEEAGEDDEDDEHAGARGKKRPAPPREGISGAAGRHRLKKLRVAAQSARADGGFDVQDDFVELMVPLSDGEEDEEGMSVDSDDLEEEEEEGDDGMEDSLAQPDAAAAPATPTTAPASAAPPAKQDEDELDYGDGADDAEDPDDDDDADVEQLLRR
ncbi:hypothetical protein JCM10450v2_004014 [Rhodotorula kratochvilovae]